MAYAMIFYQLLIYLWVRKMTSSGCKIQLSLCNILSGIVTALFDVRGVVNLGRYHLVRGVNVYSSWCFVHLKLISKNPLKRRKKKTKTSIFILNHCGPDRAIFLQFRVSLSLLLEPKVCELCIPIHLPAAILLLPPMEGFDGRVQNRNRAEVMFSQLWHHHF